MGKLLKAELYRIVKSKLFLIALIAAAVFPFLMILLYLVVADQMESSPEMAALGTFEMSARGLADQGFSMSNNLGLMIPVFAAIFVGQDVSNGTLRNKLIAGRSRKQVYFSHLISTSIVSGGLMLLYVLLLTGFGCLIFEYGATFDKAEAVRFAYFLITGLFTFFFAAAIATALSLTVKNMAGTIVATTLLCMTLSLTASIFHTVPSLASSKWMCLIPTYTTSGFLSRGAFSFTEFGLGLLSLLVTGAAVTAAGLIVFTKKDVK